MECRKYKTRNMYIRHYAMRAWTKSVVTKVTPLHQSDCDFDFSDGFFHFLHFTWTCPRLCSSTRNVDCATPFPLLCINRHAYACHFLGGGDFKLRFKILTPTKTTRKAATMRFVVSPCVLGCIKGSYAGLFREFNFNLNF